MRIIVVGLGVQGRKRQQFAGNDFVVSVDPFHADANYRSIEEVPLSSYDAALLCVPDDPKAELIKYCLTHNKHVLVEKPLFLRETSDFEWIEATAKRKGLICYTAYNHRFEPHFVRMRDLIHSGVLGKIYHCRMFYGNGTARLVKESAWRDKGAGVLPDLGSHLLDTIKFWFGDAGVMSEFSMMTGMRFENRSFDHVIVSNFGSGQIQIGSGIQEKSGVQIELEMTLLSWRNHFTCDIWAEKGSAHILSLCKWGPSTIIHRQRVFPSGVPKENSITLVESDPTWALEYQHFKALCENAGKGSNLSRDVSTDLWIHQTLEKMSQTQTIENNVNNQSQKTFNKSGQTVC